MSSDQEQKEELSRLLQEIKKNGQEIVKKASDLNQYGHHVIDLSDASQEFLAYIPPRGIDLEPVIRDWEYVRKQENTILESMGHISLPMATTSGTAASYGMAVFARANTIIQFVPRENQDKARISAQKLYSVIDKQSEKDKVLRLLQQYGLGTTVGTEKSPVELFETAWAAFDKPVTMTLPASTSLIPMRECINDTLARLLKRRPVQEPAKHCEDKVLSIGRQLAGNDIPNTRINILANNFKCLLDELSDSKNRNYSRDEWRDLLRRATLLLREFLESIDYSKME